MGGRFYFILPGAKSVVRACRNLVAECWGRFPSHSFRGGNVRKRFRGNLSPPFWGPMRGDPPFIHFPVVRQPESSCNPTFASHQSSRAPIRLSADMQVMKGVQIQASGLDHNTIPYHLVGCSTRQPQPPAIPHLPGRDSERGTAGPCLDYRTVPIYMVNSSR